jgi:sterol desaturase/sphingolipid hydroxylase (fatty acid hydroxylase superfamily)
MSFQFRGVSLPGVGIVIAISIGVAELSGYVLHRIMHSERFPWLSRSHMIHHIELYGPIGAMRTTKYKDATERRASLGNIGMEWLIPSGPMLGISLLTMITLRVGWKYEILAMTMLLVWPIFMFSYLHDRMHLHDFWMEKLPVINIWFKHARRLHDIHHHSLNDAGRMDRNYGIGFFFFDRLFGTLAKRHSPLNWHGYHTAVRRHRMNFGNDDDFSNFPSGFRM